MRHFEIRVLEADIFKDGRNERSRGTKNKRHFVVSLHLLRQERLRDEHRAWEGLFNLCRDGESCIPIFVCAILKLISLTCSFLP